MHEDHCWPQLFFHSLWYRPRTTPAPVTPAASLLFVAWAPVGTVSALCFWHSFWLILQQFSDFSHLKDNSRTLLVMLDVEDKSFCPLCSPVSLTLLPLTVLPLACSPTCCDCRTAEQAGWMLAGWIWELLSQGRNLLGWHPAAWHMPWSLCRQLVPTRLAVLRAAGAPQHGELC